MHLNRCSDIVVTCAFLGQAVPLVVSGNMCGLCSTCSCMINSVCACIIVVQAFSRDKNDEKFASTEWERTQLKPIMIE